PSIDFHVGADRYRPLGTWLDDPLHAEVQCRRSGLHVILRAGVDVGVKLLPYGRPTAKVMFKGGSTMIELAVDTVEVDEERRFLRLVMLFGSDAAGNDKYGRVVAA